MMRLQLSPQYPAKNTLKMGADIKLNPAVATQVKTFIDRLFAVLEVQAEGKITRATVDPQASVDLILEPLRALTETQRLEMQEALKGVDIVFDTIVDPLIRLSARAAPLTHFESSIMKSVDDDLFTAAASITKAINNPEAKKAFIPAKETLRYCLANAPRAEDGAIVDFTELQRLCRSDAQALAFAEELTTRVKESYRPLCELWKSVPYVPRSEGATHGEGDGLSDADKKDIHKFLQYFFTGMTTLKEEMGEAPRELPDSGGVVMSANGRILYSVADTVFFSFLRSRFPALLRRHDDVSGMKNEQAASIKQKSVYWHGICDLLTEIKKDTEKTGPLPFHTFEDRILTMMKEFLPSLHEQLINVANLHMLTENSYLQDDTRRPDTSLDKVLTPSPILTLLYVTEGPKVLQGTKFYSRRFRETSVAPSLGITITYQRKEEEDKKITVAHVHLHMDKPGDPVSLNSSSCAPLNTLLHPEHPTVQFTNHLAKVADHDYLYLRNLPEDLGIPEILEMGATTEEVILLRHDYRNVRSWKRAFRKGDDSNTYMVFPRKTAEALKLDTALPTSWLPKETKKIFDEYFAKNMPEDPVFIWLPDDEDDDEGGNNPPPPEPRPTPSEGRKKKEDVTV